MLKHERLRRGQFLDSLHLEKETRWKTVNSQKGCRTLREEGECCGLFLVQLLNSKKI